MEPKYRALRIISTIYKILGIIVGVLTVLSVLAVCASSLLGGAAMGMLGDNLGRGSGAAGLFSGIFGGLIFSVVALLYGGAISVTLFGLGEGVSLLLALEENTRATVALLRAQANPAGDRIAVP